MHFFFFFQMEIIKRKNYIERRKSFAALFTRSMESKRLDDLISSWIIVASSFIFILIFNPFRDSSGSFILENNNNKSSIVGNLKL